MEKEDYCVPAVRRTFEQVARHISQYISEEQLAAGDQLPPERRMSDLLQVSRSSVREGLRVLEMLRYLESRHGGGTYVAAPPPYLIPSQLLDEKIEKQRLDHYFQVILVQAEHIISSSFGKPINLSSLRNQNFWDGFSDMVSQLGEQLDNPFFVSLWSDSYLFLKANHYFSEPNSPYSIDELINCFLQEDHDELKAFFSNLRTK
ncbi:MAG TPA: GntR family transcriptional regulator [Bacillales bacterium]|nr:GntR family transcriptional regulator [Bacillales bacterium]